MKKWRVNLIFIFLIFFAATIISRLIYIQIVKGEYYKALAQGQQIDFSSTQGERGRIFIQDKEGRLYPVAINKNLTFAYAVPEEMERTEEEATVLSRVLGLEKEFVFEKISNPESLFVVLKRRLAEEEENEIGDLNMEGVYLSQETIRYYPQETVAAHILGFLGGNNTGQYGVEGYYDDILQGKEEILVREKGLQGYFSLDLEKLFNQEGADIVLTIDYNIQFMAEKLLQEAKEELEIEEGQIIVMDPFSGKILAFAHFPTFNPNNYEKEENLEIFQNGGIQKIFEPGSVFKPFTVAAAIDKGKITPQTTYIDKGVIQIGGYQIYNYDYRTWGERTMSEVLEKSINTGAVFAERQIGNEVFLDYIKKFKFFEPTGINLQGEVFSENKSFQEGYEINFATASFGQGIEMTPIQLARAFSVFANGGRMIEPYIVEKIIENENEIQETAPVLSEPIISSRTVSALVSMLVKVIEEGTAKRGKIPGYYIAGKTGTAQVPEGGTYSTEKTIQSFIGFAPALNPKFLILVKLNNPRVRTAEVSAVPVFRKLANYIIQYWQIPPDYNIYTPISPDS